MNLEEAKAKWKSRMRNIGNEWIEDVVLSLDEVKKKWKDKMKDAVTRWEREIDEVVE